MVVLRWHPQIVVRNDADLLQGCLGSSTRADTDFPCWQCGSSAQIRVENGGNQKANFVRNNDEGSGKTSQGSFKLSL